MPIVSVLLECECCGIQIRYYSKDRYGNLKFVYVEHGVQLDSSQAWGFDKRPKLVEFPQDRII